MVANSRSSRDQNTRQIKQNNYLIFLIVDTTIGKSAQIRKKKSV